jgi:hypothetical protein
VSHFACFHPSQCEYEDVTERLWAAGSSSATLVVFCPALPSSPAIMPVLMNVTVATVACLLRSQEEFHPYHRHARRPRRGRYPGAPLRRYERCVSCRRLALVLTLALLLQASSTTPSSTRRRATPASLWTAKPRRTGGMAGNNATSPAVRATRRGSAKGPSRPATAAPLAF